ncbi:AfsR/SARP family transcriptional regulator [Streptomyces sp. AV19]|uniref:BTAD domain-containing putative transcriptional regulator n=1 Tax=Streptomyces sp. AV19 TaxID=2793068 RepID=UPI0018FEFB6D|nr:BTAD domain-containing putative transcriptional regulator [Streptomyces sp. AV19]MBH1937488.1 AfsR/SARP family transcriptional regulator [Streptomyces sp. AV19]MDG4533737.1 AfsR/SARP family transcriptional regulator [Streptomyces sp. AV19]
MRFGVLGPLEVISAQGGSAPVPEAKVRTLLAVLLARAGTTVAADVLVDALWDGVPLPSAPHRALQAKVSQLRAALDRVRPGARSWVVAQSPGYALRIPDDGDAAVDAARFTALAAEARATPGTRSKAALLTDALALWRGPAFAGFTGIPVVRAAADRLEEERLTAVEDRAEVLLSSGEHRALLGELADLTARHPLRERLRAAHIRALHGAGRQSEALAAFEELRTTLAEELGLDPGPELVALHRAVLRQDPGLAPPAAPPTNLPAPLDEVIGRRADTEAVLALLREHRLVTLTGPGGVGKTRLALAAASRLSGTYPGGVWLVELAGLRPRVDAAGLAEEIASVLGVRDDGAWGPRAAVPDAPATLAEALRGRELLLVLDNCEHLVDPAAETAGRLLRAVPGLRVLATSQEPLALPGERLREVRPLDGEAAVRLFAARAAAATPGFAVGPGNAPAVAELVRRLDGIPLALELAAGRVRALGLPGLLARLDDRLRLLAGVRRGMPERQRTLRATIDWSWDLLTADQRTVLRRLSVHADGWDLASAEAVAGWGAVVRDDVLDVLARLVERSLVSAGEAHGEPRYRMLESVAAYGAVRLAEAGETDAARARHAAHAVDFAVRAAEGLRGPEQGALLARLDTESANLRAALDGLVDARRGAEALHLAGALARYWVLRGRLGHARRSLASALAVADGTPAAPRARAGAWHTAVTVLEGDGTDRAERIALALRHFDARDSAGRAEARYVLGHALCRIGDMAGARELTDAALADFRALGDRWGEAAALADRAVQALSFGELDRVAREGELSAAMFAELGDRWGQAQTAAVRAAHAEILGDYAAAGRILREGLCTAEELGLSSMAADLTAGLGRVALLEGDPAASRGLHLRARDLAGAQGFRAGQVNADLGLALTARRAGDLGTAEAGLLEVLAWHRHVGLDGANALVLAELGFVAELRGDAAAALARQEEGLAVARTTGDPRAVALALEGLAGALALAGEARRAAPLLGAADAARREAGAPLPVAERGDVERIAGVLRESLGDGLFEELVAAGAVSGPQDAYAATQAVGADAARP